MRNSLLDREIDEKTLAPAYFFYGEETYLAGQFALQIRKTLVADDNGDFGSERFVIGDDSGWMDVIDLIRSVPFLFSPWRIIRVDVESEGRTTPSAEEAKLLKHYFSSPSPRTTVIIVLPAKVRKAHPLVKFFSSFPQSAVVVKEMKPIRDRALLSWIDDRLLTFGKQIGLEAKEELVDLIGNDLRRLDNEMEKLTLFVGARKFIDTADVRRVSAWDKTYPDYDLTDNLGKRDLPAALRVLNRMFDEGIKPENILGTVFRMFRDVFIARLSLKERVKDKKQIFGELRPQISESYGKFYADKFNEFFALVESASDEELAWAFRELQAIDLSLKTSDAPVKFLLEEFVLEYCWRGKKKASISKAPG